jgi:hypothetical protein
MRKKFQLLDRYEAQKFASLIYIKDGEETFITEVLNIIENELVIALKDKSAHSVLFKNQKQGEEFADFIQSIIEKKQKIVGTSTIDDTVEVEKA